MKAYCNKQKIKQTDLNHLFKIYLSSDEIYLREFRVATTDTKTYFERPNQQMLQFEIADIFLPALFSKQHDVLPTPDEFEECTFTRFVIVGYIFCAQPLTDLMYDFFSIVKMNFKMKLTNVMFTYNLEQLIIQLSEEMTKSAALKYVLSKVNPANDTEITIENVCLMAVKYPIMFYPLERFRKHFKRVMFGDKFWDGRKTLKSKFQENFGYVRNASKEGFVNEAAAIRVTAKAILNDYHASAMANMDALKTSVRFDESTIEDAEHKTYHGTEHPRYSTIPKSLEIKIPITIDRPEKPIEVVDRLTAKLMKEDLGYKFAKEIIRESELEVEENQKLVDLPETDVEMEEQRIYDKKIEREFVYNYAIGTRAWVDTYVDEDDDIVREECHRIEREE